MAMTVQRVDDRHQLSLPLFYPDYKPGRLKSRSSKDVQFLEASPRSSRSQSSQRSNHKSTRQLSESNPNRPAETSLKSCLRKSSDKHANNKDKFKVGDNDTKSGKFKDSDDRKQVDCFKHTDCDTHVYSTVTGNNRSEFPTKKWRSTKVDSSSDDSNENREHVKMKGCGYTRFRYPLRFHYGSSVHQTRSGVISAIPAGLRTTSFYCNLPRRQRSVVPGSLSNEKNRRGKDEKQRREKEQSPEGKTEMENDRSNSRAASPERELNGVYHVVHEAESAQEHDSKAEKRQGSRITREDKNLTSKNQSDDDDDDDDVLEVKDIDDDESSRRSSRSSQPDRSEESIKEAGSSSEKEKLKNDKGSSSDDDDVDSRRGRRVEKRKNKKKRKKSSGRGDKIDTEYAADFDDVKSETLSGD